MEPRALAVALALGLALTACSPTAAVESQPSAAPLTAVATVFPLAWIAAEIGPAAEITQLGGRGIDPHDLELTPSEHALAGAADLAFDIGDIGFMPQVERVLADSSAVRVSVTQVAGDDQLLEYGGHDAEDGDDHAEDGDDHAEDDHTEDGDDHAEDGDAEGDGHAEGDGIDPHIWFAPSVMAQFAIAVGEAFAQADPAAAGQYRDRADGVAATLDGLDREIDELLADCRHDTVIVSHEAYAYLLSERGIRQEGVSGAGGHGEATPQRIAALVDTIRRDGITAVLTEPVEGRQDAESVAAEAGVDLIQIYSLDIVDDQQRASGYPQLVLEQAEAVARALECG